MPLLLPTIPASVILETSWPGPPSLLQRRPPGGTPRSAAEHWVYPYLLEKIKVTRPNQTWAADIIHWPMAGGFLYPVAIMDWHSRYMMSWRLSNTLEACFSVRALTDALGRGRPEVFNTDQGSQSTSLEFSLSTATSQAVNPSRWAILLLPITTRAML